MNARENNRASIDTQPYELVDLAAIIRSHRWTICEAYFYGGYQAALEAVAHASIDLCGWVRSRSLTAPAAFDPLQEVSENLGLVRHFGQDAVQSAIVAGVKLWSAP